MNRVEAERFAAEWIEAWNRRDVEAVLALFDQDAPFTSPVALKITGCGTTRGKDALRAYWNRALATVESLRFTLERIVWDPESRELVIHYTSRADGHVKRVAECFLLDAAELVSQAEVLHGVVPDSG